MTEVAKYIQQRETFVYSTEKHCQMFLAINRLGINLIVSYFRIGPNVYNHCRIIIILFLT